MLPKLISVFLKAMLADLMSSLGLIFWGPTAHSLLPSQYITSCDLDMYPDFASLNYLMISGRTW